MDTREWRTIDKTNWLRGPWDDEPDKKQWRDAATGLPCLIVRGPVGALCGYVGVDHTHPWFGRDYSADGIGGVDVHGGLTFSSFCSSHDRDAWEQMRARRAYQQSEADKYPRGDAAQWLRRWGAALDDYATFVQLSEATSVCHLDERDTQRWWFGFDCAHWGDLTPGMTSFVARDGAYRDLSYVEQQCSELARQLVAAAS